jgi:hypothetical protein
VGWVRLRPDLSTPYPILVRMVRMTLSLVQCLTEHKALKACEGEWRYRVHALICIAMDSVVSFTPRLLYVLYRVAQNSSNICAILYDFCVHLRVVCARTLLLRVFLCLITGSFSSRKNCIYIIQ